jgi:endonuclease-3
MAAANKPRAAAPRRTKAARTSGRRTPAGAAQRGAPAATASLAAEVLDLLEQAHPEARCALEYRNPFELAVATILSAQCTDERVNRVTPVLFARFPTAQSLAEAAPDEVEDIIRSTGFFRAKTKSIIGFARGVVEEYGGDLPRTIPAMTRLPGIGRKTANVVLGHAFGINEGIAVDTHVLRVTNRLGLAHGDDPLKVEAELMALVPRERWTRTTDLLIFHGRKVCDARRPACSRCPIFHLCRWESRQAWAAGAPPRPSAASEARPRRPAASQRLKKPARKGG